ncbi:MAG: Polyprenol monophosphomannose synthase [Nitrosomonadaceae bacterium]|nr:Polyprenol monophosphomannose synthase [Nitrosomonadaceae bacterium]
MNNELLIFIPTYNERENVEQILSQILALGLPADILFVDDNSPDGTGRLLDSIAASHGNVFVLHRTGKLGIGSAHSCGINWAYDQGYRLLLTMDCDLTHSPEYIRDFLGKSEAVDVVVGSRYMQEESLSTWNMYRRTLTRLGHIATGFFLRMPFDATGAFRLYRLDRVSRYFLDSVHSRGYSFFFESLYVLYLNGYCIAEIPIQLPTRVYGHSKMRMSDALHSLSHLVHTYFTTRFNRERFEIAEPFRPELLKGGHVDLQGWDSYWSGKDNKPMLLVYDLIAAFYRKFIIKSALNRFILGNFNANSRLLHAGCGSGQVDRDIGAKIGISALDISPAALSIYKKANKHYRELILGSIFNIPAPVESFDGVYNLGVMEHFSEEEIVKILIEFNRVLKPGGRMVLFWPPEFGLSVMALKLIHFVFNRLLKKNISLHPAEITRVRSRRQIDGYLTQGGFTLRTFSFGASDFFTYAVIVAEKNSPPIENLRRS